MRSVRAALNRRIGMEIRPKVKWPFQTLVAIDGSSPEESLVRGVRGRQKISPAGQAEARRTDGEDAGKARARFRPPKPSREDVPERGTRGTPTPGIFAKRAQV